MKNQIIKEQRIVSSKIRRKIKMMVARYEWMIFWDRFITANITTSHIYKCRMMYLTIGAYSCISEYQIMDIIRKNGALFEKKIFMSLYTTGFMNILKEMLKDYNRILDDMIEIEKRKE